MSGTWIPECEKCGSVEHNGLQQICDNTEDQDVLNVCDKCYKDAEEKKEYEHPTNFCSFCELFYYDKEFMSDRCKRCHDRIWAELEEENK